MWGRAMSTDQPQPPSYRASDADRERAVARIRQGVVEGRIDSEEFEQRLAAAYSARTMAEIDRVTCDLSPPPPPAPPPAPVAGPPAYYYPPPQQNLAYPTKSNGFAVASLVLGITWIWWIGSVLAVVFGHVALSQISKSQGRESGQGLAVAGLVLGYMGVATLALVVLFGLAG